MRRAGQDAARAKLRREKVSLGGQISVRVLDYGEIPDARRIFARGALSYISAGAFSWLRGSFAKALAYCASGGGLASFVTTVFLAGDGVLDPVAEKWFWRRLAASLFLCGGSLAWMFLATIAPGLIARAYVREQLSRDMYDPFTHYVRNGDPDSTFLVAVDENGKVAGTVAVEPPGHDLEATGFDPNHDLEIMRLYVSPAFRRLGIGRMLFRAALKFAERRHRLSAEGKRARRRLCLVTSSMQLAALSLFKSEGLVELRSRGWPSPLAAVGMEAFRLHHFVMELGGAQEGQGSGGEGGEGEGGGGGGGGHGVGNGNLKLDNGSAANITRSSPLRRGGSGAAEKPFSAVDFASLN